MRHLDVVGDILGDEDVGAAAAGAPAMVQHKGHAYVRASKPSWRDGQLAAGVNAHDEGMVPLPLQAVNGWNSIFTATLASGTLQGQLQKPYRAERILANVGRIGTSATVAIRVLAQFFVGVDLNQAQLQGIDIELVGAPTSFGTRMTLHQAPPGVVISVPLVLFGGTLVTSDTMNITAMFLGRIIH